MLSDKRCQGCRGLYPITDFKRVTEPVWGRSRLCKKCRRREVSRPRYRTRMGLPTLAAKQKAYRERLLSGFDRK